MRFVVVDKGDNTIRVTFAAEGIDAVGNSMPSISFLNKGQGATFVWVFDGGFSG